MRFLLQGLGIIFSLVASFLGLLYFLNGDIIISALVSCVIVVLQFFLIEQFIKNKAEITKRRFSLLSLMLWFFYLLLSVPMTLSLIHALNVEINAKKEIQSEANTKVQYLDDMVEAYNDSVDNYLNKLRVDLNTKLSAYVSSDPASPNRSSLEEVLKKEPYNFSDPGSLNNNNVQFNVTTTVDAIKGRLSEILENEVMPDIERYKSRYVPAFNNWSRLKLNLAMHELDTLLAGNNVKLSRNFSANTLGAGTFNFEYTSEDMLMDDPLALWNKHKPYLLLLFVLIFHILILLPYLMADVSGRYINSKKTGGGINLLDK